MGKIETYLLGIDIGTSSCKVAVFNREGLLLAKNTKHYNVYYPHEGWAEQNPEEWWAAVCNSIKEMLLNYEIAPENIAGIGVDGQSWSAVAVDKNGHVLLNTPIWMDTRAEDICRELTATIGKKEIFSCAGNSLQPFYTTAKIIWYKKNVPELYRLTYKILQSNSYIAYKLTGKLTQDISQGYGLHCFDMRKGIWDRNMCGQMGISEALLPDIYRCDEVIGTVTESAAKQCGLISGIPVVAGGLDAACGTLGAGVIHVGETQEQGGQAGGMSICVDNYTADPRLILGYHVVPGMWLLQGGTTGGGGVMRWMEQELADYEREKGKRVGKSSLELLNELAEQVPPGSDGVVSLPYMAGERSPIWNPNAKGVIYGLDFKKTKGHIIRSAMEGVACSLRHNLEVSEEAGAKVDALYAVGGAANSLLWTQIKADVTGKCIYVPSSDMATTLGVAILAGVGVGIYQSYDEAVKLTVKVTRVHHPNQKNKKIYDRTYDTYRKLYENLESIMSRREEVER